MSMTQKPSVANIVSRHLHSPITRSSEPQKPWYQVSLEQLALNEQARANEKAEDEARRKAERDAALSTPDLIRETLLQSQGIGAMSQPASTAGVLNAAVTAHRQGTPVPLNGAGVLRAALDGVGNSGTINGQ